MCPRTDNWIRNMVLYRTESYSSIRKAKIMSYAFMWMNLESMMGENKPDDQNRERPTSSL